MNEKSVYISGYLTLYLSLILTVILSLCLTLILGVRENTRRMQIECVTDVGMNSILAEYHKELFRQYNLLFIDTSYLTSNATYQNTGNHLQKYIEMNLCGEDILFSSFLYRDLLKLSLKDIEIKEVSAASDDDGAVLRRQAVEVMKQKILISYLEEVKNWFTTVSNLGLMERDIYQEREKAIQELNEWSGNISFKKEKDGEDIPGDKAASIWESGVLGLIVDDIDELSSTSINASNYISEREIQVGTGISSSIEFADDFIEQLLFQEYIIEYTGRYDKPKVQSLLKYQTEYIIEGGEKDIDNLRNTAYKLLALRGASNLCYLLGDKEKMKVVEITANVLANLVMLPFLAPLIQTVIIITWAMVESLYDVTSLFSGKRIPLIKSEETWHYDIDEIFSFGSSDNTQEENTGLCYTDYLRLFMCFQDKKTTTFRLMNLMEMDIRKTNENEYFRMDGCIDSLRVLCSFKSKDKKIYSIERYYGY